MKENKHVSPYQIPPEPKPMSKRIIAILILSACLAVALLTIVLNFREIHQLEEQYDDLNEYMVYSYAQEHFDKGYAAGYADGAAGNPNIWG